MSLAGVGIGRHFGALSKDVLNRGRYQFWNEIIILYGIFDGAQFSLAYLHNQNDPVMPLSERQNCILAGSSLTISHC